MDWVSAIRRTDLAARGTGLTVEGGGRSVDPYQALANSLLDSSSLPKNVGTSKRLSWKSTGKTSLYERKSGKVYSRKAGDVSFVRQSTMRWSHSYAAIPMAWTPTASTG